MLFQWLQKEEQESFFFKWSNRYSLRKVHMKYSSKLLQRPANPTGLVHLQKRYHAGPFILQQASPDDPDNLQSNFILDCPLYLQKLPNWTAPGRSIQMIQIICKIKFTLSLRFAKVSLQQTLLTMLGWNLWRSCIFKPRKWLRLKSHHSSTFP